MKKYDKMCEKSVKLNIDDNDNEVSHIHQDKVYRAFINDICKGGFDSLKKIKKDVVKYDGPNKRWYS